MPVVINDNDRDNITNDGPDLDWEVEPYGDSDHDYAIWGVSHKDRQFYHLDSKTMRRASYSFICLSNQSDCYETIDLYDAKQIDDLISRLQKAKEWLNAQPKIERPA